MRKAVLTLAALAMAPPAGASTPEAWAQADRNMVRACIAMSGLPRPQVLSKGVSFSDTIGTEIKLVRGTDNRGRMKRLLCARNRSTGRIEVQDAASWWQTAARP